MAEVQTILTSLLVPFLFLVAAFFIAKYIGRRFLPSSPVAEVATICIAVGFAAGMAWDSVSHRAAPLAGSGSGPAAAPIVAEQPAVLKDTSQACRSIRGPFSPTDEGSIDDVLTGSSSGTVVPDGGQMDRHGAYVFEGWAAAGLKTPASGVCLLVDGRIYPEVTVTFGSSRPDVAQGFHNDKLLDVGYRIEVKPTSLSPGAHRFQVVSWLNDSVIGIVPAQRHFLVSK